MVGGVGEGARRGGFESLEEGGGGAARAGSPCENGQRSKRQKVRSTNEAGRKKRREKRTAWNFCDDVFRT